MIPSAMNNKISLSFELTADPAKLKAGLSASRQAILATYGDLKNGVDQANQKLAEAQTRAQAMANALGKSGPPTKAMVTEFEKARAAVVAAKTAVESQVQALQKARQAARENADAIERVARAERDAKLQTQARVAAAATAARNQAIGGSLSLLGMRGAATIRQEIADVNRAVSSLRSNGAAAQDIARASLAAKERVAALNAELAGTGSAAGSATAGISGTAGRMAALALAAVSANQAIQLLRGSVDTGIQFQGMKTQFEFANGGDIRKAAEEMGFASQLSKQLGLELVGTSQAYAKLQAAAKGSALEGVATRDIFRAVASAGAVMGLSADEQAGALLAISQMMSKGTVSAEELKGQLGERLPGAFQIAARAMGVTTSELQKMLEAGQVMSADFLPKFAAALQASVNGSLPAAEASARAQLQRLENAFTEFKLRIANSGLLDKVAEQLERLLEHIGNMADSGELDQMAEAFASTFGAVIQFMADASIMATQFAGTIGTLAQALAAVVVGGRALALVAGSGPGIAEAGAAAAAAAPKFRLLAGALRLIPGLAIGSALLYAVDELVEWGAETSEARAKVEGLQGALRALIAENDEHASAAMRDADGVKEFGDNAFEAYQKAIEGARDYAGAKVVQLSQDNADGRFDEAIAFYRQQSAAYNEYIDTIIAGERLRREHLRLTGQIVEKEAEREKLLAGEVKQTRKEALDSQIKDYEKLGEAIRKAREESQNEAVEAKKRAEEFRSKGADQKLSAQDKATQIREEGLPEAQRQRNDRQRALEAQSEGAYYAAAAAAAQLDGRGEQFKSYAKDAEKFLDRAMEFAESAKDANLVEDIGGQQENLQKTNAKAEDKRAAEAEQQAANLMEQLNQVEAKLAEMKGEAATIKVNAEITDLMNQLNSAEAKIAALPTEKTFTYNFVQNGSIPSAGASSPVSDSTPARAYGGPLPGIAPHDRADNMLYWGTPGEWVIQRPAVRHYGAGILAAINSMRLPKFATGGALGSAAARVSVPRLQRNIDQGISEKNQTPLVLDFGALGKHKASAAQNVAAEIAKTLRKAALGFGNR